MYVFIFLVKVTEWPPIGKIAAHSAYDMFHGIKYLIVSLVFSHLGFWSGNLFLIAPFPDLCLLVPFNVRAISEPEFYGDLVYKFKKLIGRNVFFYYYYSFLFSFLLKKSLYNINVSDICDVTVCMLSF